MKKALFFIIAILVSLILLSQNHLKHSMGDIIFEYFGISPWTKKNNSGLHLPVLVGIVLLFISTIEAARFLRPRYPYILSRLVIGYIVFFLVFPFATEGLMFLVKHNSSHIDSINISQSSCSFMTKENKVIANCSFTIFNYGTVEKVSINPKIPNEDFDFEFEKNILSLDKHSKLTRSMQFNGEQRSGNVFSGSLEGDVLDIEVIETAEVAEAASPPPPSDLKAGVFHLL